MGNLLARVLASFSDVKAKVLMLGLDAAGKTTILYKLKLNEEDMQILLHGRVLSSNILSSNHLRLAPDDI